MSFSVTFPIRLIPPSTKAKRCMIPVLIQRKTLVLRVTLIVQGQISNGRSYYLGGNFCSEWWRGHDDDRKPLPFLPQTVLMWYIGPARVACEHFSAWIKPRRGTSHIPRRAEIHIQKAAPGPPIAIAPATPAVFPVPTVAASAVQTQGVIDPSAASFL